MVLGFWDIKVPIVGAPIGRRTRHARPGRGSVQRGRPRLLAGGYHSAERLAEDVAARARGDHRPIGINLSFPNPASPTG